MAGAPGGPLAFAFSSLEPVFRLHAEAGIAAAPYSQQRSTLELDSFVQLHAEKRSDPWLVRRWLRGPLRAASEAAAAPVDQGHERKKDGCTGHAKRRALATYVLGVEPPSAPAHAGEAFATSAPPHRGLRSAAASHYGLSSPYGDENAVGTPRAPASAEGAPAGSPWKAPHHLLWCSNAPGCTCADCSEEAVAARKRERQPFGVSKNPYRVLDAPNLPDDFYLNLVDWSSSDFVAVGIKGSVLLWNAKTAATEVMFAKSAATPYEFHDGGGVLFNGERRQPQLTITNKHHNFMEVANVSFSPLDPSILCVGFRSGVIELWDVENLLASGANDNLLCIWDLRGTTNQRPFGAPAGVRVPRSSAFNWWAPLPPQTAPFGDAFSFRLPQSSLLATRSAASGLVGVPFQGSLAGMLLGAPSSLRAGGPHPRRSVLQQPGLDGPPVQSLVPQGAASPLASAHPADLSLEYNDERRAALTLGCQEDEVILRSEERGRGPHTLTTASTTGSTPEQMGAASEAPSNYSSPLTISQVSPALYPSLSPPTASLHQHQQQQQGGVQEGGRRVLRVQLEERQRAARGVTTSPLCVFNEHKAAIKAVKFCPHTDALLASGGGTADRHIRFWNPKM
ncbi:hypothetical protein ACSSS7_003715 [Eimeria intestinalis]